MSDTDEAPVAGMPTRALAGVVNVSQSTIRRAITQTPHGLPEYVRGVDGKVYPSRWLCAADRQALASEVHFLRHAERLSLRMIRAVLADKHGVRRSVGWVAGILTDWRCNHCSAEPDDAPEHPMAG